MKDNGNRERKCIKNFLITDSAKDGLKWNEGLYENQM